MKMTWVWKKSAITIMVLVLHCKLKYRVWPNAHMSRLRPKILFTPKYLPKRTHETKFRQNPKKGGSQCLHEIENLSVNGQFVLLKTYKYCSIVLHNWCNILRCVKYHQMKIVEKWNEQMSRVWSCRHGTS